MRALDHTCRGTATPVYTSVFVLCLCASLHWTTVSEACCSSLEQVLHGWVAILLFLFKILLYQPAHWFTVSL